MRIPVGERGGVAAWRASDGAVSSVFMPKDTGRGSEGEWLQGEREVKEADQRLEDLDSLRQSLLGEEEKGADEDVQRGGSEREER